MRVIAGKAKGRRLKAPKGLATRPTSDRVKEALFNVLGRRVEAGQALDLFAGTGALCIEAVSRGAASGVCVEKKPAALKILRDNLMMTGFQDQIQVIPTDAAKALKTLAERGDIYDLIFVDPPYDRGLERPALERIEEFRLLRPDGVIVVETRDTTDLPETVGLLALVRRDRYGDTSLAYYQWREED